MINLLPPVEKEELLLEKKKRITIILWLLVLFFLLCLMLILFSVRIYLQIQAESQKTLLEEARKEFGQSRIQDFREEINSVNLNLTKLNSFYQQKTYFSEILEKISGILPQKIYLTNFSAAFSIEEGGYIEVSLSGFAPTADSLFEFKENLGKESDFKDIYFPPSNWVKLIDINFLATFKISP